MRTAIVLSRTILSGRMCTVVGIETNSGFAQIRLLNQQGDHLSYNSFVYPQRVIRGQWVFGREITLGTIERDHPRPTHPEDRRINPMDVRLTERLWEWSKIGPLVEGVTFDGIATLFPLTPGERYVTEQPLQRSVGYVRTNEVVITPDDNNEFRAEMTDRRGLTLKGIPIKGAMLNHYLREQFERRRLRRYTTHEAVVRLSLANPWAPGDGKRRCYLQVSEIHESPI